MKIYKYGSVEWLHDWDLHYGCPELDDLYDEIDGYLGEGNDVDCIPAILKYNNLVKKIRQDTQEEGA